MKAKGSHENIPLLTPLVFAFSDLGSTIWRNRQLVREMVTRELRWGHAAHTFGSVWLYVHPLVVTLTYILIFGVVIGTRLAATEEFPSDYISYILVGMVPWLVTAYLLGRGTNVFISNANLVKQVVFPTEVLPVAAVLISFVVYSPAFLLLLLYKIFVGGGLTFFALLTPIAMLLHALLALGVVMALCVVTPFIRDIREVVTIYTSISLYFTPAIYLPDWLPKPLLPILYLNPFSHVVWVYQDCLFYGRAAHPVSWLIFTIISLFSFSGGYLLMRRLRPYLGNVI